MIELALIVGGLLWAANQKADSVAPELPGELPNEPPPPPTTDDRYLGTRTVPLPPASQTEPERESTSPTGYSDRAAPTDLGLVEETLTRTDGGAKFTGDMRGDGTKDAPLWPPSPSAIPGAPNYDKIQHRGAWLALGTDGFWYLLQSGS